MLYRFSASYKIDGKNQTTEMTYESADIIKTLERRLKTAFPAATEITITPTK